MKVKELLKDFQWVWNEVIIYSGDYYVTGNIIEQEEQDRLYTIFTTKGRERPYHLFDKHVKPFNDYTIWAWWVDEKGLGIMVNETLDYILKGEKE
jgi:hypothetical protein